MWSTSSLLTLRFFTACVTDTTSFPLKLHSMPFFKQNVETNCNESSTLHHNMRDHAWCLTPILQGRRVFLEMWWMDFLVIRVCYVSRSKTLKSWILKKLNGGVLSTAINYTHPARAEITGILQGIEFVVVKYWYWVKSEANIPKRLGILRAPIRLVSF